MSGATIAVERRSFNRAERESTLIFVVVEDGTVEVIEDLEEAKRYEPIDVESYVFAFYDFDGTWLRPRFTEPNRSRLFGLIVTPGTFELERSADLDPAIDSFDVAIREADVLTANPYFSTLEELTRAVANRREAGATENDGQAHDGKE